MTATTITIYVSHAAQLGESGTAITGTLVDQDAHSLTVDPAERTADITRQHGTTGPVTISRQHIITISRSAADRAALGRAHMLTARQAAAFS